MTGLFAQAIQKTPVHSRTANGALSLESTTNPVVDLFFIIGASRGKDIIRPFEKALSHDKERTLRMLFWARDIRQGAGERQTFRTLMVYMEKNHMSTLLKLLPLFAEYGRWDDLLIFNTKTVRVAAYELIKEGLTNDNTKGLCAKWMPREKSAKNFEARELRDYLKMTPKGYRKMLAELSKGIVEHNMCANEWGSIDFSKVPSRAAGMYQKAFYKHQEERFQAWKDEVTTGKTSDGKVSKAKVNASAIFPHDVLKGIVRGDVQAAENQWEALPNYLGNSNILPMCDVSASMGYWGSTISGNVQPIDISISLGLYISDKQKGAFKDVICHFSTESRLEVLKGSIAQKVNQLNGAHWSMSTNLEGAFKSVLKLAVQNKVPQEEMPEIILIISDMEFNQCTNGYSSRGSSDKTNYAAIEDKYVEYGYNRPRIVFWNVNGREGNNPVTINDHGTALVSGYSPSILKAVLGCDLEEFSPQSIMDVTLLSKRYDLIGEALQE